MRILSKDDVDQTPDISVIIPTYNRISMLEEALNSVFQQDFKGEVEIIVIDDNSQDGTPAIIRSKYPGIHLIEFKENKGSYATRNQGLKKAKGKYIAFLDSDDLWEKEYLKMQISSLEAYKNCFSVSPILRWYLQEGKKNIDYQRPDLTNYISEVHHLLCNTFIATPSSVMFPKSAFDKVGLFDEELKVGADGEFYIRCLLSGYKSVFLEQPFAIKREHSLAQITDSRNTKLKQKARFMRIKKAYALSNGQLDSVSIKQVYAYNYAKFASQYYLNNQYFDWLFCSLMIGLHGDIKRMIVNIFSDLINAGSKQI
ncbi:MAG: glycosyltransferase [Tolypothrix sp. Co-bin9]|nr:glycosyltransferase [Tolypothrix sp. Co-bin9]